MIINCNCLFSLAYLLSLRLYVGYSKHLFHAMNGSVQLLQTYMNFYFTDFGKNQQQMGTVLIGMQIFQISIINLIPSTYKMIRRAILKCYGKCRRYN